MPGAELVYHLARFFLHARVVGRFDLQGCMMNTGFRKGTRDAVNGILCFLQVWFAINNQVSGEIHNIRAERPEVHIMGGADARDIAYQFCNLFPVNI